jgi:hypothetical protein
MVSSSTADYIAREFDRRNIQLQVGIVARVNARVRERDKTNHEVNVDMRDAEHTRWDLQIPVSMDGEVRVPKHGDVVLLDFEDADYVHEAPYVTDVVYTNYTRAPMGEEGLYKIVRGIEDRESHDEEGTNLERDTFAFEHDMSKEYMRMGWRDEETPGNREPTKWMGLYDNPEYPDEEPRLMASQYGTDYDIVGPSFNFSEGEIEEMVNDPAILGRVRLDPDQQINIFSLSMSEDTPEVPTGTEFFVYDETNGSPGTELRSLLKQEPGTADEAGWSTSSGDPPISLNTSYETDETLPLEDGRDEYRRKGEPVWSISYEEEYGSGTEPKYISFGIDSPSGTSLSASIQGMIGRDQKRDPDRIIYDDYPEAP